KVVVAGGRQRDVLDLTAVYADVVGVPKVEIRQVRGDDAFDLCEQGAAAGGVQFDASAIEEGGKLWVAVAAPIGSGGRDAVGAEDIVEDFGILIGADPAQIGELVVSAIEVGEERGELERAYLEVHSDAAPLVLQDGGEGAGGLLGGGFQHEMETHAAE